jgi:hypothetical protein
MRHTLRRPLTALRAGQLSDLGLHQLAHNKRYRVPQQISMLAAHRARDDISRVIIRSSAIVVLLLISLWKSRRAWTPRWSDPPTRRELHHFY